MLIKDLGKINREFGTSIDVDSFVKIFAMRAKDPKLKIPLGMESYFIENGGSAGRSIKQSIESFESLESARRSHELDNLEAEILEIENRKSTKNKSY